MCLNQFQVVCLSRALGEVVITVAGGQWWDPTHNAVHSVINASIAGRPLEPSAISTLPFIPTGVKTLGHGD